MKIDTTSLYSVSMTLAALLDLMPSGVAMSTAKIVQLSSFEKGDY